VEAIGSWGRHQLVLERIAGVAVKRQYNKQDFLKDNEIKILLEVVAIGS
jgi:hypothetical protein